MSIALIGDLIRRGGGLATEGCFVQRNSVAPSHQSKPEQWFAGQCEFDGARIRAQAMIVREFGSNQRAANV
jgi:hypothetical protein